MLEKRTRQDNQETLRSHEQCGSAATIVHALFVFSSVFLSVVAFGFPEIWVFLSSCQSRFLVCYLRTGKSSTAWILLNQIQLGSGSRYLDVEIDRLVWILLLGYLAQHNCFTFWLNYIFPACHFYFNVLLKILFHPNVPVLWLSRIVDVWVNYTLELH